MLKVLKNGSIHTPEQRVADWQIAAVQNIGQHAKYPLLTTSVDNTSLDDVAAWNYRVPVDEQACLGFGHCACARQRRTGSERPG